MTGDVLFDCQDEDLKDLGIESPIARLKICILFRRKLKGFSMNHLAERFPVAAVAKFLHTIKLQQPNRLEKYVASFTKNGIDGELLMEADNNVLKELGVEGFDKRTIKSKFKTYVQSRSLQ